MKWQEGWQMLAVMSYQGWQSFEQYIDKDLGFVLWQLENQRRVFRKGRVRPTQAW